MDGEAGAVTGPLVSRRWHGPFDLVSYYSDDSNRTQKAPKSSQRPF